MRASSIRKLILLLALVPALATGILLSLTLMQISFANIAEDMQARSDRESIYLATAGKLSVLVGDDEQLRALANAILAQPDAPAAIVFTDPLGRIIVAAGSEPEIQKALRCGLQSAPCLDDDRPILRRTPIQMGLNDNALSSATTPLTETEVLRTQQEVIGDVIVSYSTVLVRQAQRRYLESAALVTLGILLSAGLIARVYARRISLPIFRLFEVVRRIEDGDLTARVAPSGTGEIQLLERGVNAMADRIKESADELQKRIRAATADLEHRMAELDVANRAKDNFLARMSHEMRTPLSSIISCSRLIDDTRSADERQEHVSLIQSACRVLLGIIDDVLALQTLDKDGVVQAHERAAFNLHSCVNRIAGMARASLRSENKAVTVKCVIERDVPNTVIGDERQISQVLFNLMGNAVKFTHSGSITLQLSAGDNDEIVMVVRDTGIGITEQQKDRLFQPFTQADESTRRRYGGTGLGLSISRALIHAMQGDIALESDYGRGTTVTIRLALPEAPRGAAVAESATEDGTGTAGINIHVLVVEDNPLNRSLIAEELSDLGAVVDAVEDGPTALQTLANRSFDLVLTDVMMPGMDGATLAGRIRERWPQTPVFALTANAVGSEDASLMASGVRGIFLKPFDQAEMRELLVAWSDVVHPEAMLRADSQRVAQRDVVDELTRLFAQLRESFDESADNDERIRRAHELLGLARMFCKGPIVAALSRLHGSVKRRGLWVARADLDRAAMLIDRLGSYAQA